MEKTTVERLKIYRGTFANAAKFGSGSGNGYGDGYGNGYGYGYRDGYGYGYGETSNNGFEQCD